jgi:hypothetical protein
LQTGQGTLSPWSINVEGKPYRFSSKQQAIEAVRKFQHRGVKSIDVGCMQINLKHHPRAFQSLEQAFDPQTNIAYAARFLKQLMKTYQSWNKAVGAYHSLTPHYSDRYKNKVFHYWQRLNFSVSSPSQRIEVVSPSPQRIKVVLPTKVSQPTPPLWKFISLKTSPSLRKDTQKHQSLLRRRIIPLKALTSSEAQSLLFFPLSKN